MGRGIYPEISFTETRLGQGATMALPVFGKFYSQLNSDNDYNTYTQAQFKPMKSEWVAELDCDPFKEDFKFFDWLFGKEKKDNAVIEKAPEKEKEDGFFKKIGGLFKKKKKK